MPNANERNLRTILTLLAIVLAALIGWILAGCTNPSGAAVIRSVEVGGSVGRAEYDPAGSEDARDWSTSAVFVSLHPLAGVGLESERLALAHEIARANRRAELGGVGPWMEPGMEPGSSGEAPGSTRGQEGPAVEGGAGADVDEDVDAGEGEGEGENASGVDDEVGVGVAVRPSRWWQDAAFLAWIGGIIAAMLAAWQGRKIYVRRKAENEITGVDGTGF